MVGSLATALRDATSSLREVEGDVSDFIASLFPGWRPLFPTGRGWIFVAPGTLHVYGVVVVDSPASTAALHLAGFHRVVLHDHRRSSGRCMCIPRIDPSVPGITPPRGSARAPSRAPGGRKRGSSRRRGERHRR